MLDPIEHPALTQSLTAPSATSDDLASNMIQFLDKDAQRQERRFVRESRRLVREAYLHVAEIACLAILVWLISFSILTGLHMIPQVVLFAGVCTAIVLTVGVTFGVLWLAWRAHISDMP